MSADAACSRTCTGTAAARATPVLRTADPAHRRRPAHPRQQARVDALFVGDDHVQLEATYGVYQQMVAAYRERDRAKAAPGWRPSS